MFKEREVVVIIRELSQNCDFDSKIYIYTIIEIKQVDNKYRDTSCANFPRAPQNPLALLIKYWRSVVQLTLLFFSCNKSNINGYKCLDFFNMLVNTFNIFCMHPKWT